MSGYGQFGEFANINPEQVLAQARERTSKITGLQESLTKICGTAESSDGYIKASYSATGLRDLEINPRAMRMASSDLAETIKSVISAAAKDFQENMHAEVSQVFSGSNDNPLELLNDPDALERKVQEMQGILDGALNDTMATLDTVRKQLNL